MTTTPHEHHSDRPRAAGMNRPLNAALLMVAVIGGFYLLREHWNHLAGNWIYLLLLVCPLLHFFHGHGRQGGHGSPPNKSADKEK